MKRLAAIGVMTFAGLAAIAQPPGPGGPPPGAMAPPPPRARGPQLGAAVDLAQAAVASCLAQSWKVTALVTDRAGVPVAMLSGDGAAARTQQIAALKIAFLVNYYAPNTVTPPTGIDPVMMDRFKAAIPATGAPRMGALPLMVGTELIGAVAVSGAPGMDKDESCAQAGLNKVKPQLR